MKSIEEQVKDELDYLSKKIIEILGSEVIDKPNSYLVDNITKAAVALSTSLYSLLSTAMERYSDVRVPEIWIELSNLSAEFSKQGMAQLLRVAESNAKKKHKVN